MMLVQISPVMESVSETLCSLRFASKVHSVEFGAIKRNFDSSIVDFNRFKDEMKKIKEEMKEKEQTFHQKLTEAEQKVAEYHQSLSELESKYQQLQTALKSKEQEKLQLDQPSVPYPYPYSKPPKTVSRMETEESAADQSPQLSMFLEEPTATLSASKTIPKSPSHFNTSFYESWKEHVTEFVAEKENFDGNPFRTPTKAGAVLSSPGIKKLASNNTPTKRPNEDQLLFGSTPFQRPAKKPLLSSAQNSNSNITLLGPTSSSASKQSFKVGSSSKGDVLGNENVIVNPSRAKPLLSQPNQPTTPLKAKPKQVSTSKTSWI